MDATYLSDLWYFIAAAQSESFSAAASERNVTQGAISQRVRRLEQRLGLTLFQRAGRGVVLTPAGQQLLQASIEAFNGLDDAIASLKPSSGPDEIVLSCIPSLAMDWLFPRLASWYQEEDHSILRIKAEIDRPTRESMIREGVDLAIRFDDEVYDDLHCYDLGGERYIPVCAPSYKAKLPDLDDEALLKGSTLLHDETPWEGARPWTEWEVWMQGAGMVKSDPKRGQFFNLTHLATRSACLGAGIALGRELLVKDYLERGDLVPAIDTRIDATARYKLISLKPVESDDTLSQLKSWLTHKMAA